MEFPLRCARFSHENSHSSSARFKRTHYKLARLVSGIYRSFLMLPKSGAMASPRSTALAWAWVLETLSDVKEVDTDILKALIIAVPDLSSSLHSCKTAGERICLRFIEEWIGSNQTDASASSSEVDRLLASFSNLDGLDLLKEVAASTHLGKCGAELKQGLSQFIVQKRAALPKCDLQKLKDAVTEECHPSLPFIRERVHGPSTRERVCADTNDENHTAKRLKAITSDGEIPPPGQNCAAEVLENGNQVLQEDPQELPLSGTLPLNDENHPAKRLKAITSDGEIPPPGQNCAAEVLENGNEILQDPQELPLDGTLKAMHEVLHQDIHVDEAENGGDHVVVPETSSCSDKDQDMGRNFDPNDEMFITVKHMFLSCQTPETCDSLATDWTEQKICVKCQEGGQLLICSGSCILAVHESCLGSSVSFEDDGKFYCPFCSYVRAHAAYRKAKKKASVARKALSAFIGKGLVHQDQQKQPPLKIPTKQTEARIMRNTNYPDRIHADRQQPTEIINNIQCVRAAESHQVAEAAIACNIENVPNHIDVETSLIGRDQERSNLQKEPPAKVPPKPKKASAARNVTCTDNVHEDQQDVDLVNNHQCVRAAENNEVANTAVICNEENVLGREMETCLTSNADGAVATKGNAETVSGHREVNEVNHQKQAGVVADCTVDNSSSRERETSPIRKKITRGKRKDANGIQCSNLPDACLPNINEQEVASNQNRDGLSSGKRMKRRKPAKRYINTVLPFARRNKLFWTPEEEEALKEGVNRYSKEGENNMPWSKILEFGQNIFHKTRTPGDLKDKWRNMARKL